MDTGTKGLKMFYFSKNYIVKKTARNQLTRAFKLVVFEAILPVWWFTVSNLSISHLNFVKDAKDFGNYCKMSLLNE